MFIWREESIDGVYYGRDFLNLSKRSDVDRRRSGDDTREKSAPAGHESRKKRVRVVGGGAGWQEGFPEGNQLGHEILKLGDDGVVGGGLGRSRGGIGGGSG